MFVTAEEETDHVESFNHWGKKAGKKVEDEYFKFSRFVRNNLATTHGTLLSLCDDGLKDRFGT